MYADLHMHSTHSDGTDTPQQLLDIAKERKVGVIALADHDTVSGVKQIMGASDSEIEIIPAVEISTSVKRVGVHILGYFIDVDNPKLLYFLQNMGKARTENTKMIFTKLNDLGLIRYSWEDVLSYVGERQYICNVQVFEAMMHDGLYTWSDYTGFYTRYFSARSEAYIDLAGFSPREAVNIILESGGIPVLAHPKLIGNDDYLDELIEYGVQGLEVFYPAHADHDVKKYLAIARQHNLLITGGTDWHGKASDWNVEIGDYGLSKECIDELRITWRKRGRG